MTIERLQYVRCNPLANKLVKIHQEDAGYDLQIMEDVFIEARCSTELLSTGLKVQLPDNTVGLIWPRSSLAMKGIETGGGVIDSGYTGEIKLILRNHSDELVWLHAGDRVAQLIIQPFVSCWECETTELNSNTRGGKGFGSTGK